MNLFKTLDKYKKKRTSFYKSEEFSFYTENRPLLNKMPKFSYLNNKENPEFDIIRINILLYSYLNKVLIEEETASLQNYILSGDSKVNYDNYVKTLKEKLVDAPYIRDEDSKIYIPFFSKPINLIYLNDPIKLTRYPYVTLKEDFNDAMIDPFDTYGYELFNSYFSRLIKIKEYEDTAAFFHYNTNTIYIINKQGRLDTKIVLFDRFIRKPNYNHMLERISPVISAYYSDDRKLFLEELKKQGFLSSRMYYFIRLLDWRRH